MIFLISKTGGAFIAPPIFRAQFSNELGSLLPAAGKPRDLR